MDIFLNIMFINYRNMGKRICIVIDDDMDKKLRLIQAKAIQNTSSSVSYSRIINETLRNKLK